MLLTSNDKSILDGSRGEVLQKAMEALVQLGEAFDAKDMVDIGYAHVHAGMALYKGDVELIEELASLGAKMKVPSSTNIANVDMGSWKQTNAPEKLVLLQKRAEVAHESMGTGGCFTCTPYWAGHWPTWNTHMVSIESGVTIFSNSVLGALSNRDGYFATYAGLTGRYPRFGYHLQENRKPTHLIKIEASPSGTSDFTALGYAIGLKIINAVPLISGLKLKPNLDELDAMGVGMATSGGMAMFVLPDVTPPYTSDNISIKNLPTFKVNEGDLRLVYDDFCNGNEQNFDIVHLGCPHASYEEMKHYAKLLNGKKISNNIELWITTNRTVREMIRNTDLIQSIESSGAKIISDTCPISCHFARTVSPDPKLGIKPPKIKAVVVDSAKQARYIRDMIHCPTLFTSTEKAVESAVCGNFIPRW